MKHSLLVTSAVLVNGLLISSLASAATVEFWTAQTQTDRLKTSNCSPARSKP